MIETAVFMRKASTLKELKEWTKKYNKETSRFTITKDIELNDKDFKEFCKDFLENRDFIIENSISMGYDNDAYHCILVYNKKSNDGILVENEGYGYARYTAVVDMSKMNEVQ